MNELIFPTGSVPVSIAVTDVKEMNAKLGRINFYISPKALYEQTGFLWRGKHGTR